jgi:hypothetical protein
MQKTVKITIAIIVILAIAAAIIYNTNIPAASTNSTNTPIFNVLPSFDKQPAGNFTVENVQIQQGNKHYSVTWHGEDTVIKILENGILSDFPVVNNTVYGLTVNHGPMIFYSNTVELITFFP